LGHHICYLFIVYLTTLPAAQNVRRRKNRLVKNLERRGFIPVSSTIFSFAKQTQQNLKKPWESGHNDWYVTSRTHVRSSILVQYVATRCAS